MNVSTLTCQQVRQVDRRAVDQYGMSSLVLMENAGRGVADQLVGLGIEGSVVIVCGKGNNAGDGFVIARHLDLRGYRVEVVITSDPAQLQGDAMHNFRILQRTDTPMAIVREPIPPNDALAVLSSADWVVDALLGTGARGEPRPPLDAVIDRLNACGARKLAVDVPSGLDCDTGQATRHTLRADHTCTFVAAKPGFFAPGADQFTGQIHVLDIGVPRRVVEEVLGR